MHQNHALHLRDTAWFLHVSSTDLLNGNYLMKSVHKIKHTKLIDKTDTIIGNVKKKLYQLRDNLFSTQIRLYS